MQCRSFAPVARSNAGVLILGTMPSVTSIKKQQYYGNPKNHFWKIIAAVLDEPLPDSYEQKLQIIMNNRIALWDLLAYCYREGSADSAIEAEEPNDFQALFKGYPDIGLICFNGTKARDLWKRHVGAISRPVNYITLPSSSPTPGKNVKSLVQKIEAWMVIKDYLEKADTDKDHH